MDINILRAAVTVLGLISFLALVAWVWARHRREAFEEAALLPFQDDEPADLSGVKK
jgi:cytochrome c oxidase cbb3-type subunit IV